MAQVFWHFLAKLGTTFVNPPLAPHLTNRGHMVDSHVCMCLGSFDNGTMFLHILRDNQMHGWLYLVTLFLFHLYRLHALSVHMQSTFEDIQLLWGSTFHVLLVNYTNVFSSVFASFTRFYSLFINL